MVIDSSYFEINNETPSKTYAGAYKEQKWGNKMSHLRGRVKILYYSYLQNSE